MGLRFLFPKLWTCLEMCLWYCFFPSLHMALSEWALRKVTLHHHDRWRCGAVRTNKLLRFSEVRQPRVAKYTKYTYKNVRINLLNCSKHRLLSQLHHFSFTYISSSSGMDRDKCYPSPEVTLMICSVRGDFTVEIWQSCNARWQQNVWIHVGKDLWSTWMNRKQSVF